MEEKIKEVIDVDEYKSTIFDKIKWWFQDARFYPRDIITGLKNLWKWFPIIWKDRDWDDHYIFEVLKFKLKKQAKYIGDRNFHTTAKRDAEIMSLVVRLIEKEQDEYYNMEYMDYQKNKHYFVETDEDFGGEKTYEWKCDNLSENFDEYFKKYPRQYKKAVSGKLKRFLRYDDEQKNKQIYAMEIAHENQERCHKLMFKILDENIRKWWD
jgi:hypothetical protein